MIDLLYSALCVVGALVGGIAGLLISLVVTRQSLHIEIRLRRNRQAGEDSSEDAPI